MKKTRCKEWKAAVEMFLVRCGLDEDDKALSGLLSED